MVMVLSGRQTWNAIVRRENVGEQRAEGPKGKVSLYRMGWSSYLLFLVQAIRTAG